MIKMIQKIFVFAGEKRRLLTKATIVAFIGAVFGALQFGALMLILDAVLSGKHNTSVGWMTLGIMVVSIIGRIICMYYATNAETETGYFMVAEKRIHIGDRLRYIPMGYFNQNSLGSITGVVTTTLGDVENTAARCLVTLFGGFLNTFALSIMCGRLAYGLDCNCRNCYVSSGNRVSLCKISSYRSCKTKSPGNTGRIRVRVHTGNERSKGIWLGKR